MIAAHHRPATPSDAASSLLIVGASARAAAQSATRAGLHSLASDLFNDLDLPEGCGWSPLPSFDDPDAWPSWEAAYPPSPWIYTGGLENQPAFIDWLASRRPLWGNSGTALRASRDPIALNETLRHAGLPSAEVRATAAGLPRDGSWVRKPLDSAGGFRIDFLSERHLESESGRVFQEYIPGEPLSALFMASRRSTRLRGVTRQLLGWPGCPFAYRGSIGPWPIAPPVRKSLQRLGDVLREEVGLVGLFGVDFVLAGDRPHPIEVNPRYTASAEVLEHALGIRLLDEHRIACEGGELPPEDAPCRVERWVGKEVLFADYARCAPCRSQWPGPTPLKGAELAEIADLPRPETEFRAGDPIFTVLATGESCESMLATLESRKDAWRCVFNSWPAVHESREWDSRNRI